MLTQISLIPTSCRCFGNPSSIVPSKAVCTKHRVLCTQQTRPSRGTLIPSAAARSRGSPLRIYATATARIVPRVSRSQAKSLLDGYRELHSRAGGGPYLPVLDLSQGAAGSSKHTCIVLFCVSFVCASRSLGRAMISNRHQMGLELIEMAGKRDATYTQLLFPHPFKYL